MPHTMLPHRSFSFFLWISVVALFSAPQVATPDVTVPADANHWLTLQNPTIAVGINKDLSLSIYRGRPAQRIWETMSSSRPNLTVEIAGQDHSHLISMASADEQTTASFHEGHHRGTRIRLQGYQNTDLEVELILALGNQGELLIQVDQVGGQDTLRRVGDLYDWHLPPDSNAYTIVPHGSGYIIRSDSDHAVNLANFIGAGYSLPLFAMVQGPETLYQIIETWWDAQVKIEHQMQHGTQMSLNWEASLGQLNYARRLLLRFEKNLDHVGIAKAYRQHLIERGEFQTLAERCKQLPKLAKFLSGVEYRAAHWGEQDPDVVIANIHRFRKAGLPVTFFYPKWPSQGMAQSNTFDAGWQSLVHPNPVPGGWAAAKDLLNQAHAAGCLVKRMITPHYLMKDAPRYDPKMESGTGFPKLSFGFAESTLNAVLDHLETQQFNIDSLYFDGHSAHHGYDEHKSPAGPVSRRQTYEAQMAQFRETRRRGIVPGAELARFWAIAECDFFFFTDWASDRLRNAEPIPWVPLVFHDCYGAHFSGGGYYNEGKYDWYEDRHPRLYELMYAAMPSHNWLPGGSRPIEPQDWETDKMSRRLAWLKRWHNYYQAVCYAEMTSHRYMNSTRTQQRVEFANGVMADFDLEKGRFRVQNVTGFSGDWEKPENVER